jgi:hypothetical protein
MANWFVRSLATGTGAGTSWTNAATTLNAAITLGAAGDTYFVADDHAETTAAALVITFKGGFTNPDTVICVDHTIASPTSADVKTTGQITTTGTSNLAFLGSAYIYGIIFSCGTGAGAPLLAFTASTANRFEVFEACKFILAATGAATIQMNTTNIFSFIRWINTVVQFSATTQSINPIAGMFEWKYTSAAISGATFPTTLFTSAGMTPQWVALEGVDLSALGSGKSLFNVAPFVGLYQLKDCKLGSSVSVTTGTTGGLTWRIDVIRCDSGNTNYRNESYSPLGTQTTETTIVRSGGATDGTTAFSHKVVTNANAVKLQPYEPMPFSIWNDTTGSAKTITVEGIASAVPNNDEVWMEVEYLGDASFPLGSRASTYKTNILAAGAANTTSTQTWGGALTGKFKMAVTITPQQKGPITVYAKVSKASTTVYIDPFITVT